MVLREWAFHPIESVRGQGYRFLNASVYDMLMHGSDGGLGGAEPAAWVAAHLMPLVE